MKNKYENILNFIVIFKVNSMYEELIKLKEKSDIKIAILAGAGLSAASGIPTFRGEDGLWKNYEANQLATPIAFKNNPKLVWEWYLWRINLIMECQPNEAHKVLVNLEEKGYLTGIITQNVDGMHHRVGSTQEKVVTIHGDIMSASCTKCSYNQWWNEKTAKKAQKIKEIPVCPKCGEYLRPDVVWFGEGLNPLNLEKSYSILEKSNVLLLLGTSGYVYPVAGFPQYFKNKSTQDNVKIIYEFNIEETPLSSIALKTIIGPVEKTLPAFLKNI